MGFNSGFKVLNYRNQYVPGCFISTSALCLPEFIVVQFPLISYCWRLSTQHT